MISYAPEEAELIESGALTNKTELLIIQCEVIQYEQVHGELFEAQGQDCENCFDHAF